MTGSYKIALLVAALLCALVVGYYVLPGGDDTADSDSPVAESPTDEGAGDEPRSLVRNSPSSRAAAPRPGGTGDEMAPMDEVDATPALPAMEDPGLVEVRDNDEPVLPVAGDGRSLRSNPYGTIDVDDVDHAPSASEDETPTLDPSRVLTIAPPQPEANEQPEAAPADDEPADEPTPASRASASTSARTYTVESGDTLSSIARDHYGAERHWVAIARANPRVDPIRLRVGQELRLPDRDTIEQRSTDDDLESPPGTLTHIVRPGETLSTIAQQHYNDSSRWRVIFNANRDLLGADPDRVTAGDELTIPPLPRN